MKLRRLFCSFLGIARVSWPLFAGSTSQSFETSSFVAIFLELDLNVDFPDVAMSEGKVDYLEKGCRLQQASAFRKGSYIILKDKLCRVVDMSTSKTGKHGSAKVNFTAQDIFTGRKVQEFCPSTESLYTFDPTRSDWTVRQQSFRNMRLSDFLFCLFLRS